MKKTPTTKSLLIPAVGYVRMSSSAQEASPDQQRAEVIKLAAKHGCEIIRWYFDEAISGAETLKRKQFQALLADAKDKGDFQVILAWDQDRFSRGDSIETGEIIAPLRRLGIRLITVAQGEIDWTAFAGRMVYSIQQEGKNQFLHDLSRNVTRGHINGAKSGIPQGSIAFGYDREYVDASGKVVHRAMRRSRFSAPVGWQGRFVIAEDGSPEIVRRIFEQYVNGGKSLIAIATELNREGIPSPQGATWSSDGVCCMLKNRVYVGDLVYGKRNNGKFHRVSAAHDVEKAASKVSTAKRPDGRICIENAHPAIVTREMFDAAQSRLIERSRTGRRTRSNNFVAAGILHCGHCGARLVGQTQYGRWQYYHCVNKNGGCKSYSVRKEVIERILFAFISKWLLSPQAIESMRRAAREALSEGASQSSGVESQKQQLAELERRIERGSRNLLLAEEDEAAGALAMLREWKSQRDALKRNISQPKPKTPTMVADDVVADLLKLQSQLQDMDPYRVKQALGSLVNHVAIYWTRRGARGHAINRIELGASGSPMQKHAPELIYLSPDNTSTGFERE